VTVAARTGAKGECIVRLSRGVAPPHPSSQLLVGAATVGCALVALAASWRPLLDVPTMETFLVTICLVGATIATYQFPLHVRPRTKVYMSSVPFYLLAVLVSPPLAGAAAGVAAFLGELSVRKTRGNGVGVIAAEVGRRTLVVLLGSLAVLPVTTLAHMRPVALVVAAVVLGVGDVVTFPLVLVGRGSERPWRLMAGVAREAALMEGAQYLLGLLGALVAAQQLWAVVLLAGPTALVYRAVRVIGQIEQAQARAEAAQRVAEQAVRVRDEFLITASHDLRTPLTNIIGRGDLIQARLDRAPRGDDWVRVQMRSLLHSARRMSTTIEEVTDVAHLHMGQTLTLKMEGVDIGELLRVMGETSGWQDAPSVTVDTPDGVVVRGDRARLERAFENIVENARKYSVMDTPVQVAVRRQEQWTIITVRDRGVGIPASELPHIFIPFYRASTARGVVGTGIGLAGANAIVVQHGGSIMVESVVDQGTTMIISLPQAVARENGGEGATTYDPHDVEAPAFTQTANGATRDTHDAPSGIGAP